MIDIEIDKLTNSIENAISGDAILIKEPNHIDFYVINESISIQERALLLAAIANQKSKNKKIKKQETNVATA